ncbi:MAG: lytic murein transglycosylase [Zetaproteobacteria bacterium CG1_02_53_45]|nr:MAG: lytic murein transglycosylase [Zetaproteobacteria bacterium CG1_02_53_45]
MKNEAWQAYGRHWKPVASRSQYVRQPLIETLDHFGYPRELQMVPVVESSYDPYVISSVGATGLWQLMPETASDLDVNQNKYFDGRRDIRASTRAAAKYLTRQYRRFGNWEMALAAYHLGPTAVQRRLDRHPWKPADGLRTMPLPPITKTYIRQIIGLIALQKDGLISFPKPFATETIKVQTPIDINALQEKAELPEHQIFRLNPKLRLNQYVDGKPETLSLRISKSRLQKVKQSLASTSNNHMQVTVASGENLDDISKRYNTSIQQVRASNPDIEVPLKAGQKLRLPVKLIKRFEAEGNPMLKPVSRQKLVADNSGPRI